MDSITAIKAGKLLTKLECPACLQEAVQDYESYGKGGSPYTNIEIGFECHTCRTFSVICATVTELRIERPPNT